MTDERDLHDPLDAAWRAQSTRDAAAGARRGDPRRRASRGQERAGEDRTRTRSDATWRWWTPLAAAAVIGVIAIGALQLLPQEPDPTKVVVSDMPSTGAKSAAPAAPQAAPSSSPSSSTSAATSPASSPPPASPPSPSTAQSSSSQPPSAPPPPQSARAMTQDEPPPPKVAAPAAAPNALRSRAAPAESAPRQEQAMSTPPPAAPAEAPSDFASREEKVVGATRPAPDPFPARSDTAAPTPAPATPAPAVAASPASAAESRATGRAGSPPTRSPRHRCGHRLHSLLRPPRATVAPKLDKRAVPRRNATPEIARRFRRAHSQLVRRRQHGGGTARAPRIPRRVRRCRRQASRGFAALGRDRPRD